MWSVFFVFLSYLDRNFVKGDFLSQALDAEKENKEMLSLINGTFCVKTSVVGENFLYQVSDGAEVVRSVVSPAGRLVSCSVIVNRMEVKSFMHECRLELKERQFGQQFRARFAHMDEAKLMCREFKKSERSGEFNRDASDDSEPQKQVLKRSRRGFTYPGTLWCGAGNMADHYGQLGEFADTDSCCRTHDHCPHVIHAFSSKYGYTNFKWHSICHCDCDNALKDCLRKVNDTSSRVVGQAFFNVIGVPCFHLTYEEQCAERHWYGMCKRYEKLPIAVLQDAVPYDFGGIDIIDELPLPTKESQKEDTESTTQSTIPGPEEPSLRNVMTAAEDFIKVLATVSTSQSSTSDSEKGEAQSSEKKKRKNSGKKKKTTKKQKGKGKGRKKKQKAEAGIKIEESATVSTSGSKAEEVKALSNFINKSHKHDQLHKNSVSDSGHELGGKQEPSNEVMKDEPVMDKQNGLITSTATVQKKPDSTAEITPFTATSNTTAAPEGAKTRELRKGRRKKNKTILPPPPPPDALSMNTTDISVPTVITITPVAQPEQQSVGSNIETRAGVSTARTPIVSPKVKRNRSKERGDKEGRKKRRKDISASPIEAVPTENSSVDNLKVIPLTGAPTIPSLPHRLDVYGAKTMVTSLNSSFSVLKKQRLQNRGLKGTRRKTVLPPSSKSENGLIVLPSPETSDARIDPATSAAVSRPSEGTDSHSEWRLYTAIMVPPSVATKTHRQIIRQQKKSKKKGKSAAFSDGMSVLEQTEPMTFTTTSSKVATTGGLRLLRSDMTILTTSGTPVMSPIQLSIERVKAQFSRKKRRKAALYLRKQ